VVAECADGGSTIAAVRAARPDLLLLDVQMPELDGFEVLAALGEDETPAVVFVTAYDAHALRAFEVHALDYLLKPFSDERFAQALARARAEIDTHGLAELARRIHGLIAPAAGAPPGEAARETDAAPGPGRLLIPEVGRTRVVRLDQVDWIEAADYYARVHLRDRSHLLRRSLSDLERELDPRRFVRIHRSTIVNVDRVAQLRPLFKGDAVVELEGGRELRVSRQHRARLLAAIEGR
jgi:two-component system LytT family response regulator